MADFHLKAELGVEQMADVELTSGFETGLAAAGRDRDGGRRSCRSCHDGADVDVNAGAAGKADVVAASDGSCRSCLSFHAGLI